jgi:hypothetical protein
MFIPIKLDKMRNFRYGMKAISLMEKKLGKPAAKINFEEMTMEEIATVIWAGLVHEDKDLTPDKVMELIDDHADMTTVITVAGDALAAAFGVKEEPVKNARKAAPSA